MTHYQLVAKNKRRSTIVTASFILFIVAAAYLMAQAFGYSYQIVALALIFSGITSFISYYWSHKIVLAISNAKPARREEFFDFYTTVENLAMSQRMPMPDLYVIEDSAMNAFATGRDPKHAVICATTGLLNRLDRAEIEGVMAHEMGHVQNYDIRLMSIVSVLVGFIALISDWMLRMTFLGHRRKSRDREGGGQLQLLFMAVGLLLALLSPIIARLIKLALSRRREFLSDAASAAMTKNPEGLARALEKISMDREPLEAANKATAHLYIANPLKNRHDAIGMFANLFQTHPAVEERIAKLRGIA